MSSFEAHIDAFKASKDVDFLLSTDKFDSSVTVEHINSLIDILQENKQLTDSTLTYLAKIFPENIEPIDFINICQKLKENGAHLFIEKFIIKNPQYKKRIFQLLLRDKSLFEGIISTTDLIFDDNFRQTYFSEKPNDLYLLNEPSNGRQPIEAGSINLKQLLNLLKRVPEHRQLEVLNKVLLKNQTLQAELIEKNETLMNVLKELTDNNKKQYLDQLMTENPSVKAKIEGDILLQTQLLEHLPTHKMDLSLIKSKLQELREQFPLDHSDKIVYLFCKQLPNFLEIRNNKFIQTFLNDLTPKKIFTDQQIIDFLQNPENFYGTHREKVLDLMIEHEKENNKNLDLQVVKLNELERFIRQKQEKRFQAIVHDGCHYIAIDVLKNEQPPHSVIIMDGAYLSIVGKLEEMFHNHLADQQYTVTTIEPVLGRKKLQHDLESCLLFSFNHCLQMANQGDEFHQKLQDEKAKQYVAAPLSQLNSNDDMQKNIVYLEKLEDRINYKVLIEQNGKTRFIEASIEKNDLPPSCHADFDKIDNQNIASVAPIRDEIIRTLIRRYHLTPENAIQWHQLPPNFWWNAQSLDLLKECEAFATSFDPNALSQPLYENVSYQEYKSKGCVVETYKGEEKERNKSIKINILQKKSEEICVRYTSKLELEQRSRTMVQEGKETMRLLREKQGEQEKLASDDGLACSTSTHVVK